MSAMIKNIPILSDDKKQTRKKVWSDCRFLTCSVLPVRMACNLKCPFCFSKSSISSLKSDDVSWSQLNLDRYFEFSRQSGATRLVITGGGEPLLRSDDVVSIVRQGRRYFNEIACFTNGTYLTTGLSQQLADAGLSYFCYSRHHHEDGPCRRLMGAGAPALEDFVRAAGAVPIRATCVMTRGWIDSPDLVEQYIGELSGYGVCQFTFKHTYVAYAESVFASSAANAWSREHQMEDDPFAGRGEILARLPWGPCIRRIGDKQVCYYYEPTPDWELENQLCRSINLLSNLNVYASLEDQQSLLFRLNS